MTFTIPADPLGNAALAAAAATVPVALLFLSLVVLRWRALYAGLLGAGAAVAIAAAAFGMPVALVLLAALHGALFGLVPIATVVVAAGVRHRPFARAANQLRVFPQGPVGIDCLARALPVSLARCQFIL